MADQPLRRNPAWFGSVMGTSALAVAFWQESAFVSWFAAVAQVLLVLASIIALVLLPVYASRPRHRADFMREVSDPSSGAMLATFPAGLLLLAAAWGTITPAVIGETVALAISAVLLAAGAIIAVALSVLWAAEQTRGAHDLSAVNGCWLIPPAMNLLVPLSIAPQMVAHPEQAALLFAVGFGFYGVGLVLFLAVFALLLTRLALRPPLPTVLLPAMWIPIAPATLMGLSLTRLLQAGITVGLVPESLLALGTIVSAMGVGLGLWWTLYALGNLMRARRSGGVPFHPGWWGFVFPLAALQISVADLGALLDNGVIEALGLLCLAGLALLWCIVAYLSSAAVVGARRGA